MRKKLKDAKAVLGPGVHMTSAMEAAWREIDGSGQVRGPLSVVKWP